LHPVVFATQRGGMRDIGNESCVVSTGKQTLDKS